MIQHKAILFLQTWILVVHGALLVWSAQDRLLWAYVLACMSIGFSVWQVGCVLDAMRAAGDEQDP
jgi:hypothetical protein